MQGQEFFYRNIFRQHILVYTTYNILQLKIGRDMTRVYRPCARGYIDRENSGKQAKKKSKRMDPLKRLNKKVKPVPSSPTWSPKKCPPTPKRNLERSMSQPIPKPNVSQEKKIFEGHLI